MSPDDWLRAEELFHIVIAMSAEERPAYLTRACSQDASLRAEVESLIAAFENQPELMNHPVLSLGLQALSDKLDEAPLVGKQIGPYAVLELLGRGGMGDVYLAMDGRLDRKVALKFLSSKLIDDAWAKRQFIKEAHTVAKLNHPNICAVYEFEEYDGYRFIAMQHVEGETLASLISKRLIEPEQILPIAIQIVSALVEAHSHGISHRDIKPQNIIITGDLQVKVLDFGLAKLVQQRQNTPAGNSQSYSTQIGLMLGTVAYMSPEQLRDEKLDFRSDIFSLGIVLYQMITGKNPYSRESKAETIVAILTVDPTPLTSTAAGIPAGLLSIIEKCLNKDREQRYPSVNALLLDIDNSRQKPARPSYLQKYSGIRSLIAFVALLMLLVVTVFTYSRMTRGQALAILPIYCESTDPQIAQMGEELTGRMINKLSQRPGLSVSEQATISAYKGQRLIPKKVGRELGVNTVLVGTITRRTESPVLHLALISTEDGAQLWGDNFILQNLEAPELEAEISVTIAFLLQLPLSRDDRAVFVRSSKRQSGSITAYERYLLGRYYWDRRDSENIQKAIGYFNQAIELDPLYAKAYAGLADCYVLLNSVAYGSMPAGEAISKARAAAKDALRIDAMLSEAHTSLGVIRLKYDWNWQEAEQSFQLAIRLDSDYAPAHFWYSQLLALTGHATDAVAESKLARDLAPFSPLSDLNFGRTLYLARQFDASLTHFEKILKSDPENKNVLYMLGLLYIQTGATVRAVESLEQLYQLKRDLAAAPLGYAYAKAGRGADAMAMLSALEEMGAQQYVSPVEKAIVYMGLGDYDNAFRLFTQACGERAQSLPFIKVDPLFDSLRSDPRYEALAGCAKVSN